MPTARTHPVVIATPISLRNVMKKKLTMRRRSAYPLITRRNDGLSIFSVFWICRLTESPIKNAARAKTHLITCQFTNMPPPIQKCSLFATPGAKLATKKRNVGITPIHARIDPPRSIVPRVVLLSKRYDMSTRINPGSTKNIKSTSNSLIISATRMKRAMTKEIIE